MLNDKCQEIVIGTYISQKAYGKTFVKGNIYQAAIDFLRELSSLFQTKAQYITSDTTYPDAFSRVTQLFEANHDYSQSDWQLPETDKQYIDIWQSNNQKEEIEHVAKAIRQKLYQGYRYKDILVLLGDVDAYHLQVGHIFDKFEIPYYFGKAESMSDHPLVQFIDSLERSRRYNWRREDILNLVKSGLFANFTEEAMDRFEQYLDFADINGYTKFSRDFTINSSRQYPLEELNELREAIFNPLKDLFKSQKQLGSSLLAKLMNFFKAIQFLDNFKVLSQGQSEAEYEKDKEVWKTFTDILEDFQLIFGQQKMSLDDSLSLLKIGMQTAHYRTVPATVDVVAVKSYDLIEPHAKPFVFAIGLTQSHFPKQVKNNSLISDQERQAINDLTEIYQQFDIPTSDQVKKSHQTALSLLNAATNHLVLSVPHFLNDVPEELSPYLKEWLSFGLPLIEKGRHHLSREPEDIGNYKALLSRLINLNRDDMLALMTEEDKNFWTVALRYVKKRLKEDHIVLTSPKNHLITKKVASQVIEARFPSDQPLSLSASALRIFYNNQYHYFLKYVLGLQELESIHPDARIHGQYLHRVFERLMKDHRDLSFDAKLREAIGETNQEKTFQAVYSDNLEAGYSLGVLQDIVQVTASVLERNQNLKVIAQEKVFQLDWDQKVLVRGVIDRIDQLHDGSLGIVDYKSSANKFDIGHFYNGLSPQLVTYLATLKESSDPNHLLPIFGAMYLHLQDPKLDLSQFKALDQKLVESVYKELTYKGIFLEEEKEHLSNGSYQTANAIYQKEELETLLAYNKKLYLDAADQIRKGHFLINPYTEDGKSVQGEQLKAITRFEADLDLGQARPLLRLPAKEKRQAFLTLMNEEIR